MPSRRPHLAGASMLACMLILNATRTTSLILGQRTYGAANAMTLLVPPFLRWRGGRMDAEVCAALSLDLAALWAPSSMSILPPAPTPPSACSGGGGGNADGAVAPEAFFFGGMSVKTMKI